MLILVLLPWADGVVLHTVTLGRERVNMTVSDKYVSRCHTIITAQPKLII